MWDDQIGVFGERYRVIRCDLPGFGASRLPASGPFAMRTTIARFLEEVEATPVILIGCSFGARVSLELAVDRPELVRALILVCPGIGGYAWSEVIESAEGEIEQALERGDLDTAAEVDVRVWVDGPRRTSEQVNPRVREKALSMARGVYEVATSEPEPDLTPIPLDPPALDRLGEITIPTLIITGELDQPDIMTIARMLVEGIPETRMVTMSGVAHLPNMEQPDAFNEIVLSFLDEMMDGSRVGTG
ncbi:MAG: alpha/beta hydrolase [Chloroflexota bacterium]|nr:alpha/beta hydrolase [Chloroflexota bacterium]